MKITGYKKSDTEVDGLMVLSDIAIATTPDVLRELASFLQKVADEMDELGTDFDRLHLIR